MNPSGYGERLQLVPDRWYGWQMLPGYGGERCVPYFSPIYMHRVEPKKTGKRILGLSFFNVFYAQGVQDFQLDLRILKHEANFLIGDLIYTGETPSERAAVISHIEFGWIEACCPWLWENHPPSRMGIPQQQSVTEYLNAIYKR